MLSCSCKNDSSWWYELPDDFTKLETKKRKRCSSCNELIDIGTEVVRIDRWREALTDIEERICGQEVHLAPIFQCVKCGEIFLNLTAYGYCVNPMDQMSELLEEHKDYTGFYKCQIENVAKEVK